MQRVGVLLAVTLTAAACSSPAATTPSTTGTAASPQTTAAAATATTAPGATRTAPPATAPPAATTTTAPAAAFTLDDHVDWIVGLLNGEAPTEAGYEERFDEGFRAMVPYDAFVAPVAQLAGVWAVVGDQRSGREATVRLRPAVGAELVAVFVQEPGGSGRLGGLVLQPAALDDPPDSLDALVERWAGLAPQAALLVADESCTPIAGEAAGAQLAVGSVFKLWVLHALATAVLDGDADWDEALAVQDGLRSLPSGTMQDEPAGAEFTLRQHAELMISISDNTATDHLIDRLGRATVEDALAATEHAEPARNRPFLTTRELFWLKLAALDAVVTAYVAGDEAARRAILDGAAIDLAAVDPAALTAPLAIETLEWFATPGDVCRVLTALRTGFAGTPVTDVLTANPGVAVDAATWPVVAFKGGSEPGVLALAWHATRADGQSFVVAGILNDPAAPVDEITAVLLAERAFELLAE